jgi:hypothetical protein
MEDVAETSDDAGVVQRLNAARGERDSACAMKGEVTSPILNGRGDTTSAIL